LRRHTELCWLAIVCLLSYKGVAAQEGSAQLPPEVTPKYDAGGNLVRKPISGGVSTNNSSSAARAGEVKLSPSVPQSAVISPAKPPKPRARYSSPGFLVTTTSDLQGYTIIDYKGLVEGAAVREPTWNEDASASLVEPYGGSLDSYAQLCEEARVQSYNELVTRAKEAGANAVVGVHFDSQSFELDKGKFATAVVCVGTAVVVKPAR